MEFPDNITHKHLLQAIEDTKQNGYPSKQESTDYDLLYEDRRYPPKVIIRRANYLANGFENFGFSGGVEHANKFLQQKGFIILEKGQEITDTFFNKYEIDFLHKHSNKKYLVNNAVHKTLLYLGKGSLRPKTDFWANSITPKGFIYKLHTSPLKQGHKKMTIRGYTWASIYRKRDEGKGIYFTVGIHAVPNSNNDSALVYKLDCQFDGKSSLSEEQIEQFNNMVGDADADWKSVALNDIKNYNWDRLISKSKLFIKKNIKLYDEVINIVLNGRPSKVKKTEQKICRICWNNNGWVKPSGMKGKSKSESHEKKYGFGHEEWLFDFGKVIDGFHYSFLEPVRTPKHKYENQFLDLYLYSVDDEVKQKYWIGEIHNVQVIDKSMAISIINKYKEFGWYDLMKSDLYDVGLDPDNIVNKYLKESEILNIRFKENSCKIYEKPIHVIDANLIRGNRYVLLPLPDNFGKPIEKNIDSGYDFNTGSSTTDPLAKKSKKSYEQRDVELELKHNELSTVFLTYLQKHYPEDESRRECKAFGQTKIDIVRRTKSGQDIFYELKTYNNLKTSLRVAIGQLFEYCFFPKSQNAHKLYVVSDKKPNDNIIKYISHLNKFLNIPLGYIQYDLSDNKVVQIVDAKS